MVFSQTYINRLTAFLTELWWMATFALVSAVIIPHYFKMFDRLPYELVCKILSYLDSEDFVSTSLACKTLNKSLFDLSTCNQRLERYGIILGYQKIEDIGLDTIDKLWKAFQES